MVGLAQLIMRSRLYAMGVALAFSLLPALSFLGAAAMALVTLRKGAYEGGLVLLATLAPALYFNESLVLSHYGLALVVFAAALVLRSSVNLFYAILVTAVGSALLVLAVDSFAADSVSTMQELLSESLMAQGAAQQRSELDEYVGLLTLQVFGMGFFLSTLLSLLIGRWWQARLYNPGGFQVEFHNLRSPFFVAMGLMLVGILFAQIEAKYMFLAVLALLPIMIPALGLVHYFVKQNNTPTLWLVLFYLVVLLIPFFGMIILLVISLLDSYMDLRRKLPKPPAAD